jgi:hypothetical protein
MKKGFSIQDYLEKNKIELGSIKKEVGSSVYKGGHNDLRKTTYDVNIQDGKFQLNTHKTILTEGVSYPSQYDAETMLEWWSAMEKISGGESKEVRSAINECENIRFKVHQKIFGDKSPWSIKFKGSKKEVIWDNDKADKLGL